MKVETGILEEFKLNRLFITIDKRIKLIIFVSKQASFLIILFI